MVQVVSVVLAVLVLLVVLIIFDQVLENNREIERAFRFVCESTHGTFVCERTHGTLLNMIRGRQGTRVGKVREG